MSFFLKMKRRKAAFVWRYYTNSHPTNTVACVDADSEMWNSNLKKPYTKNICKRGCILNPSRRKKHQYSVCLSHHNMTLTVLGAHLTTDSSVRKKRSWKMARSTESETCTSAHCASCSGSDATCRFLSTTDNSEFAGDTLVWRQRAQYQLTIRIWNTFRLHSFVAIHPVQFLTQSNESSNEHDLLYYQTLSLFRIQCKAITGPITKQYLTQI
jgi:hypothetical protein